MSVQSIEVIIGRAITDLDYREKLFTDPDTALHDYDLTDDELSLLKIIDLGFFKKYFGALLVDLNEDGIGIYKLGDRSILINRSYVERLVHLQNVSLSQMDKEIKTLREYLG